MLTLTNYVEVIDKIWLIFGFCSKISIWTLTLLSYMREEQNVFSNNLQIEIKFAFSTNYCLQFSYMD